MNHNKHALTHILLTHAHVDLMYKGSAICRCLTHTHTPCIVVPVCIIIHIRIVCDNFATRTRGHHHTLFHKCAWKKHYRFLGKYKSLYAQSPTRSMTRNDENCCQIVHIFHSLFDVRSQTPVRPPFPPLLSDEHNMFGTASSLALTPKGSTIRMKSTMTTTTTKARHLRTWYSYFVREHNMLWFVVNRRRRRCVDFEWLDMLFMCIREATRFSVADICVAKICRFILFILSIFKEIVLFA